jgi:hypothetical protein
MSVSIVWSHSWSASDDGTVLGGADLQDLQNNIASHSHTETINTTGAQTKAGVLTLTSDPVFPATSDYAKISEFIFYNGDIVSWEEVLVYYRT